MSRALVVAVTLVTATGCYDPTIATGVPCGPNGACPRDQRCSAMDVCEPSGGSPADAAIDGGALDAADAAPDAHVPLAPAYHGFNSRHGAGMVSVPSPPDTADGDLLVAHVGSDDPEPSTILAAPGWVRVAEQAGNSNNFSAVVFVRPAGNATVHDFRIINSTRPLGAAVMAFANLRLIDGVEQVVSVAGASSNTATIPSVTTTTDNALLLAFVVEDLASTPYAAPTGMTVMHNESSDSNFVMMGAYEVRPMAGPTGVRTARSTDEGPYVAIAVAIAPR